jgi:hypothetical protein
MLCKWRASALIDILHERSAHLRQHRRRVEFSKDGQKREGSGKGK